MTDAPYTAKVTAPTHPCFGMVGTCHPEDRSRSGLVFVAFPDRPGGCRVAKDEIEAVSEGGNG
jgi:hypothetical protein